MSAVGEMISMSLTFTIEKCVNSTKNNNNCHSPEQINEFLQDISVDVWAIENNMDLSNFKNTPKYRQQ